MQRKHLLLASGVALLCTLAAGYTWVGLHSFAAYRTANANYAAPCGDIITWNPPSSIYTGLYPNQPGLVNVRYRSQTPQTLRLSVTVPQLTEDWAAMSWMRWWGLASVTARSCCVCRREGARCVMRLHP